MHLHTVAWACTADAAASAVQASQSFAYAITTTGTEEKDRVYGKSALKTQHFAGLAVLFHVSQGGGPVGSDRGHELEDQGGGTGAAPPVPCAGSGMPTTRSTCRTRSGEWSCESA